MEEVVDWNGDFEGEEQYNLCSVEAICQRNMAVGHFHSIGWLIGIINNGLL